MPDTGPPGCGRLALPIGFAYPQCGLENFEGARARWRNSKGCSSIPSRSEKFGETRRSLLFFPCGKGLPGRESGLICPGAGKQNRGVLGPDIVPFRRIFEHLILRPGGDFHKAKLGAVREFIMLLFNGLQGVGKSANRVVLEAAAEVTKRDTLADFSRFVARRRSDRAIDARSNAHGHYYVAVARGFVACGAELACGLFVFQLETDGAFGGGA